MGAFFIFKFALKLKIRYMMFAILLGLIAVVPISFLEFIIPDFTFFKDSLILSLLLKSVIVYGLIEELLKAALIIPLPKKNTSLRDFLLLSFCFGLTLGCFESVVYYLDHWNSAQNIGATVLYVQIFVRIFTSDIIHMTCAGLGGLFIYSIWHKCTKISCIITAVLLHGLYDFFVPFQLDFSWLKWFAIPVIILAALECRIKYKDLEKILENSVE